ncbi:MAG: penicillin-binding protein 2 [Microthrixaceae bacterium]
MNTDSQKVRLGALGIVALSLFLALFARLWFLQGIERQEFEAASVSNRLRVIQTEGPRGRILDVNGKVIVDNRTTIVVALDREPLREKVSGLDERDEGDLEEIRQRLWGDFEATAEALNSLEVQPRLSAQDIWERYTDKRYSPQEPVPVAEDVDERVEQYFLERWDDYPGMIVERRTVRDYPYGSLAAHVLGYVGEINKQELLDHGTEVPGSDEVPESTTTIPGQAPKPYEPGDTIGKTGVERAYEADLRGTPGARTIEVNSKGEMLDVVSNTAPKAGEDVWLTIDIDLQAKAEAELARTIGDVKGGITEDGRPINAPSGAAVITDPMTAGVRAMASYPTYDPRLVVNGIPAGLWDWFQDEVNGYPLNNWVTQGTWAPGSTFKPVTAIAGIQSGFINSQNQTFNDRGTYELQNCESAKCVFRNAGEARLGTVDLQRSLTVSSDVYYYWIGENLWLGRGTFGDQAIQDAAFQFGLGSRTGIELSGEVPGRIPTPQNRKEAYAANPDVFVTDKWFTGDNLNTAIGQGDVLLTPLQLVNVYGTLANGGTVYKPHVGYQITRTIDPLKPPGEEGNYEVVRRVEPEVISQVEIDPGWYARIFQGLIGVTQDGGGTAADAWGANPTAWPFAGKTGTAQVSGKADTSLFAGWGPAVPGEVPQYAVAVVIPESGFGGDVAAPLTFDIISPASRGQLDPVCPVSEPARSECETSKAAAYRRLEAAQLANLAQANPQGGAGDTGVQGPGAEALGVP